MRQTAAGAESSPEGVRYCASVSADPPTGSGSTPNEVHPAPNKAPTPPAISAGMRDVLLYI
jgi:hypothetical protein